VLMLESRKRSEPTILDSGASGILSLDNVRVKTESLRKKFAVSIWG